MISSSFYRWSLINKQKKKHAKLVVSLKKHLSKIKYIACTADILSRDLRSFIAVNAHWISEQDGCMKSALLACNRFAGNQSADAIADKLKGNTILFSFSAFCTLFILSFDSNDLNTE